MTATHNDWESLAAALKERASSPVRSISDGDVRFLAESQLEGFGLRMLLPERGKKELSDG